MGNEDEQPPSERKPLEYWHSRESPADSTRLAASLCGGLVLSASAALFVGFICGASFIPIHTRPGQIIAFPRVIVVIWCAIFIAAMIMLRRFSRTHRELSLEARRQPARFFRLGLLIGVGVGSLLCGFCFRAM